MKKLLVLVSTAVLLTACGDPKITFKSTQCLATFTGARDNRSEQGPCIRWNMKRDGTQGTCAEHVRVWRTYLEREVKCKKREWIR